GRVHARLGFALEQQHAAPRGQSPGERRTGDAGTGDHDVDYAHRRGRTERPRRTPFTRENEKIMIDAKSRCRVAQMLAAALFLAACGGGGGNGGGSDVGSASVRLSVLAGTLDAGGEGDVDGRGTAARFKQPTQLGRDPRGRLLVLDSGNANV